MNVRSMKLLPLAVALLAVPMFAHAENLMDAYQQAVANDPTLAQELAQRNITGESVPLARAPLLPQLSAGLSMDQTNGGNGGFNNRGTGTNSAGQTVPLPNSGHMRTRNLSLNLTQTILNFSDYANLSAAKSLADSADATYQANLQNLIVRVSTAYFNVLTAKDAVAFNQANVTALKRQYDQAQQRFKVGLSAITDVQDAKSEYESARAQLIAARNSLSDAREALTQITGHPAEHLEVLTNALPMAPPSPNNMATWVKQAKLGNPNILAQQFNVDAAGHDVSAARDARLPTIGASVSYGKGATWYQNNIPGFRSPGSTTIGLKLTVPLFSGGATRANIEQSIYQRDSAQAALTAQRRLVVRNTRNYFRSVNSGISQIEAAKAAVIASESALKATQAGFLVGTQTITQVLIDQENLMQSRQLYSLARHQFVLNKLLLKQATGTLDVKDLRLVNALLEPASEYKNITGDAQNGMDNGAPPTTMPASQPATTQKNPGGGNTTG